MGEKEDREKAEKLAAAKKRVAQLQKKKKKDAGTTTTSGSKTKARDKKDTEGDAAADEEIDEQVESKNEVDDKTEATEGEVPTTQPTKAIPQGSDIGDEEDPDTAAFNQAIKAANTDSTQVENNNSDVVRFPEASPTGESTPISQRHNARQPSISVQSKIRSTSFRQSNAPLSPSVPADADDSIYRKQTIRIEELEQENKRLTEYETRWRKSEEELEELREKTVELSSNVENDEISKLREEISVLRRNARTSISAGAGKTKQSSTSSTGASGEETETLRKDIESKESTIADLQLEISRMRTQVSAQTKGCEIHGEQIDALQSGLEKAEIAVKRLEGELADTKKALSRASEKAVVDGTEQTSKDTKILSLERENEELVAAKEEADKRIEGLEKKIDAMNKIHRETEQRTNSKLTAAEEQAREAKVAKSKVEGLEHEVARLREARKRAMSGSGGDDGLDELEDEERKRLEKRVRDLEGEVFDLKRGMWRDKRKELQPGMTEDDLDGDEFDDVDLTGSGAMSRRRSTVSQNHGQSRQQHHSGFTQVINSGLAAFRSTTMSPDSQQKQQTRPRNDSLLQDFDDDAFDENAFAMAQREEEMRKMVEHVREVKRGLKKWQGWRLDLVDARRGGGGWGVGEIFDV